MHSSTIINNYLTIAWIIMKAFFSIERRHDGRRAPPPCMASPALREMSANIRVLFVSYPVVLYVCRSSIFCHRLRCLLGALVLPTARLQLIVRTTALFSCHIRFRPLHTVFATGWQSGWRRGKTHVHRGLAIMIAVSATAPTVL